jgi:3-deoxy-D-manno-octulosonate 8-phosphate phosphatase (KDO 8-P phosphatase)
VDTELTHDEVAYIGDDLIDIPLLRRVGLAVAVADAVDEVKAAAHLITQRPGGQGAVREVIELILRAQDHWDSLIERYTKA